MVTDGLPLMMKKVETQNLGLSMEATTEQHGRRYIRLPDLVQPRREILGKQHKHTNLKKKSIYKIR